MGWLWGFVD